MTGTIFNIQRFCTDDGPGIRTTVFFKGCNLRCAWCHNPESQAPVPQLMRYSHKCVGCGRCRDISETDTDFVCLHDAREYCGKEYTPDELLREALKDKIFYETSGGGITCSGGECMLQIDCLEELLKQCKTNGIHTAVDTAGHVPYEYFERILPYTDLFLYDIKCMNSEKHRQYTGVGNERILENLKRLLQSDAPVWIRIPVIPSVNDTLEEMRAIQQYWEQYGTPKKIELLPYHAMGEHKYTALGRTAQSFSTPDEASIEHLKHIFS